MDKEAQNIFEMTNKEASIIIGNIPVYPDDCYSIAEYQWAKSMAIKTLEEQPFINKPCISKGVCREDKIQVLNKIRAEVENLPITDTAVRLVTEILDKYKVESEDTE